MPRHPLSPPERFQLTSPCTADWDLMTGNERVRFCGHCRLHVHDVSEMTPAQALNLMLRSPGRLCLRVQRRPDGTVVARPSPAPLHQLTRRVSRVAAGAFGAALSLCGAAAAQAQTNSTPSAPAAAVERSARPAAPGAGGAALSGVVRDPHGAAVPGASATLTNERTGASMTTQTNDEGAYDSGPLEAGTYTLRIEWQGFEPLEVNGIELREAVEVRQDTLLVGAEMVTTMGVVAVVEPSEPLVKAAFDGDLGEVRRLLRGGADINVVDKSTGTSALSEAVSRGNRELVSELLGAGAEVNARLEYRQTALMRLTSQTSADIVRELIFAGARVNLRDEDGNTALMSAAAWGAPEVVDLLLKAGARVNARSKGGETPLMCAARAGATDSARALISAGADLDRRNHEGATALHMAREYEHAETADLLVAYGAADDGPRPKAEEESEETAAQP